MNWYRVSLNALTIAALAIGAPSAIAARSTDMPTRSVHRSAGAATTYYVDFLARPTQYFGHSYVQVGEIDRKGKARPITTAGFYPRTAKSVFDAPGIVTATSPDLRGVHSVRYRVSVSEQTYRKTTALIRQLPKSWRRYDLVSRNCNNFIGRVAGQIGLSVSGEYADLPENFVREMQALNGGRNRAAWREATTRPAR